MPIDPLSDAKIVDSWVKNAQSWTTAIRENQVDSRRLVTNGAIVAAVLDRGPRSVLDIGCGEGWLARALAARGIDVVGVDAVPALVEEAKRAGGGDFRVASYAEIVAGKLDVRVDVAVANFSLIGEESVADLVAHAGSLLNPSGALIVQTLHPVIACGEHPYEDGWRTGSWAGFSGTFTDPAPWFFRTIGSWIQLLADGGLHVVRVREPLHPITNAPASIIFIAETSG